MTAGDLLKLKFWILINCEKFAMTVKHELVLEIKVELVQVVSATILINSD